MAERRRLFIYAGILVFLFVGGGGLSAGGSQEESLAAARQLIVEKHYNEALLILTEIVRNDAKRADEAESLIRQIRVFLGNYNDRYEDLIHVLYEEKDVAKALQLIKELESIDPFPSPATAAALGKARDSASFIYEQQEFTRIMNEALALLDAGRFWEAVALYESSIGLGRERFDAADYGNIVRNRVDSLLAAVKQETGDFRNARRQQETVREELRNAVESGNRAALVTVSGFTLIFTS